MISELENLLKSQGYKIAFLTKDKERMLTAFEKGTLTPIFVFYQDKSRINIGHFWKRGGCAEVGFSEAVNCENLSDVFIRIQELRKEIQKQTQIPYLDEHMRWQGYFTNPDEIIKIYAEKFGYSYCSIIP